MNKIISGIAVIIIIVTSSCLKEPIDDIQAIKGFKAAPTWALPVINAEAGLKDFVGAIDDGVNLGTTPDKVLLLTFISADSLPQQNLFNLPQVSDNVIFSMTPPAIALFEALGAFEQEVTTEEKLVLPNSAYAERAIVKKGSITANVQSSFKHDCKVYITYPGITKNGIPLIDSFIIIYNGSTQTINRVTDLVGYEVDFTKNGATNNTLEYTVKANITRNLANPVSTTDNITATETIKLDEYSRIEGYFGELDLLTLDEVNVLSLFDKNVEGQVFVNNPKLFIDVTNTVGMPITGKVKEIFVTSGSGIKVPIILDQFADTFSVNYTTTIGQSAKTQYIIDKTNSNIDEILSTAPQSIKYVIDFTANKGNKPTPNILYDYSSIRVGSFFEIPFDAKIFNYVVESNAPFNLSNIDGDLDTANFRVEFAEVFNNIKSTIPLNGFVQIYFEDSITGTIYDSLYNTPFVMPGAKIDATGSVIAPSEELVNSYIDGDKFNRIKKSNRYRLRVRLRTSEDNGNLPFVRFYEDQKIKMKVGFKTKISYKS